MLQERLARDHTRTHKPSDLICSPLQKKIVDTRPNIEECPETVKVKPSDNICYLFRPDRAVDVVGIAIHDPYHLLGDRPAQVILHHRDHPLVTVMLADHHAHGI